MICFTTFVDCASQFKKKKKNTYTRYHTIRTYCGGGDGGEYKYMSKMIKSNIQFYKFKLFQEIFQVNTQTHYIFMTEETKETSRFFDKTLLDIQRMFFRFVSLSMCVCVCRYEIGLGSDLC